MLFFRRTPGDKVPVEKRNKPYTYPGACYPGGRGGVYRACYLVYGMCMSMFLTFCEQTKIKILSESRDPNNLSVEFLLERFPG